MTGRSPAGPGRTRRRGQPGPADGNRAPAARTGAPDPDDDGRGQPEAERRSRVTGGPAAERAAEADRTRQLSEAEAELAAQRELRERIERRKAEKEGPIAGRGEAERHGRRSARRGPGGGERREARGERLQRAGAGAAQVRAGARAAGPGRARPAGARAGGSGGRRHRAGRARRGRRPRRARRAGRRRPRRGGGQRNCARTPGSCCGCPGCGPSRPTGSPGRCSARSAARTTSGGAGRSPYGSWSRRPSPGTPPWTRRRSPPRSPSARCRIPTRPCRAPSPRATPWSSRTRWTSRAAAGPAPAEDDGEDAKTGEAERPVRVLVGLERYALAEESLADGLARRGQLPAEGGRFGRGLGVGRRARRPAPPPS